MIIDITGTVLIPGDEGGNCPGNGLDPNIECCCDECDYMQCCLAVHDRQECDACMDQNCPYAWR